VLYKIYAGGYMGYRIDIVMLLLPMIVLISAFAIAWVGSSMSDPRS